MNRTLYLCEKPSQARVLANLLGASQQETGAFVGDEVVVTYCYGHMHSLAMPDEYIGDIPWKLCDLPILPTDWIWKVKSQHQEQFDNIGKWLAEAKCAVIATDPDEEGEVIGRQVLKAHQFDGLVKRLWVSSLDQNSLKNAVHNLLPLSATDSHFRAGLIRHELDWLFGMNLSRAFSIKNGQTAHVGRIKTRLLSELTGRENTIKNFVPTKTLAGIVNVCGHDFNWSAEKENNAVTPGAYGYCSEVTNEIVNVSPPLPFSLSELLIQANLSNGLSLNDGYAATQMLYEAGAISYPRTSSTLLPRADNVGFAVHHAIMSTQDECPKWADSNMRAIFGLVRKNCALQNLGAAKVYKRTTIINFDGRLFKNVTQVCKEEEAGWLICAPEKLYPLTSAKFLDMKKGQVVDAAPRYFEEIAAPPSRFTEASLLKMMTQCNIGTESTRVESIANLTKDRVAFLDNGVFRPTISGLNLVELLPPHLGEQLNLMVQDAVEHVRIDGSQHNTKILEATKWLAMEIRGNNTQFLKMGRAASPN